MDSGAACADRCGSIAGTRLASSCLINAYLVQPQSGRNFSRTANAWLSTLIQASGLGFSLEAWAEVVWQRP